jgi:acetyl esterase/lipase
VIDGVLLRGPVTCNAIEGGKFLPNRFKESHTSMSDAFHTSLLNSAALNNENRTITALPLEAEDLSGMPRHWIQVSTNDIYYSDGACYAEGLREAGVEVRLDVIQGWPHTFWLKAPYLERAVQAESDMIKGLRWLLEDEVQRAKIV